MQIKIINAELNIYGEKVILDENFLNNIIDTIPNIKENQKIFDILASNNSLVLQKNLHRISYLSKKNVDLLLNFNNEDIMERILKNPKLAKLIDEEMLLKIIDLNNTKLLITIAENINNYAKCDISKISKILASHSSVVVKSSLQQFGFADLPLETLEILLKDSDEEIADCADAMIWNMHNG